MSTTDMGVGFEEFVAQPVKSSAEKGTSGDEPPSSTVRSGGEARIDCHTPRIVRSSARIGIRLGKQNLKQSIEGLRQKIVK